MSKQSDNTRKRGKPGRKPAASKTPAPRRRRRNLPPGRGAERLISSVNVILNDESDRIARALVDKTIAGNMSGARLLVELSGAKHQPAKPEEKAQESEDFPSLDEMLMCRGQWVKQIEDFDRNPPFPGESLARFWDRASSAAIAALPAPEPALSEVVPSEKMLDQRRAWASLADGDLIYIHREGIDQDEIYDLRTDPREMKNLATDPATRPQIERLRAILDEMTAGPLTRDRFRP